MKRITTYLLLLVLALTWASCVKKPKIVDPGPPFGIFSGQFTMLRKNTLKYDTLKANLKLILSTNIGFSVQGDTSTVHAGSYGPFSYDPSTSYFTFHDNTFTSISMQGKAHLNGTYLYSWDGKNMKIGGASGDSLIYIYDLTKIGEQ